MKKFLTALLILCLASSFACASEVKIYDGVKLHAFATGDNMADECYVFESAKGLVILESTAYKDDVNAFNEYIKGLNKPVVAALLSYHPNGYKTYGDVKVYATEGALKSWQEGGSVKALTDGFVQMLGDKVATDLPSEAVIIHEGDQITLAGITFKILKSTDGANFNVEIPALNAVYRHMMGAKVHNILPSIGYIDAEIADLKSYQEKNYDLILTSHNVPEGKEAVAEKIAYLEKVKEIAQNSKNAQEFTEAVKKAFPDYAGEAYIGMSAGMMFK